jgi:hypothetical protein
VILLLMLALVVGGLVIARVLTEPAAGDATGPSQFVTTGGVSISKRRERVPGSRTWPTGSKRSEELWTFGPSLVGGQR